VFHTNAATTANEPFSTFVRVRFTSNMLRITQCSSFVCCYSHTGVLCVAFKWVQVAKQQLYAQWKATGVRVTRVRPCRYADNAESTWQLCIRCRWAVLTADIPNKCATVVKPRCAIGIDHAFLCRYVKKAANLI